MDVSPTPRFAPWTVRPMDVLPLDDSPHACGRFAPELSVLGVSPSRCGRTDGRFDVEPLALASVVKSLASEAKVKKHLTCEAKAGPKIISILPVKNNVQLHLFQVILNDSTAGRRDTFGLYTFKLLLSDTIM